MNVLRTVFFVLVISLFSALIGAGFFFVQNHGIDFSALEQYQPGKASVLLDDQGQVWASFSFDKRAPVALSALPPHLINAFIAAEDWAFFNHCGLSVKGIIRSILVNLYHGRKKQGASTITQQLVRLLFFDAKKTFTRKLQEQVYALLLEYQFTKEQILQAYLNHIYFGCGIYGVQAAADRFWGKKVADITVDEAATLAATVCSPNRYCPLTCPRASRMRRDVVLRKMVRLGFITPDECAQYCADEVTVTRSSTECCAPHAREMVRQFLECRFGKKLLYTGGLVIQTTLNIATQCAAENAFQQQIATLRTTIPRVDGALISCDVSTGQIKALVGGYDFVSSHFNRATQARRQMGSVFKPLVYAAALEQGAHFTDTAVDEPTVFADRWAPNNYDKTFAGSMTRAWALSRSNNIIAVKTFLRAGSSAVVALAKRCQLSGITHGYPSLALGCVDSSLQEVVGMFNCFANNGVYVQPHCIQWVKNTWGKKIWQYTQQAHRVLPAHINDQVASVLQLGVQRAKSRMGESLQDVEAICKTGTTNDSRTCWFAGSTPSLTTVVYIGCDDNRSMGSNVYPIRTAFPIWCSLNNALGHPVKQFAFHPSLYRCSINRFTGLPASSDDHEAITLFM